MTVELISGYDSPEEIRALFAEYTQMLILEDETFKDYLAIQNYDKELEHLEEKYGEPDGRLYLARVDGETAGCIALRKIDMENCEMKRLYVRDLFWGHHVGDTLVQRIIEDAKQAGYRHMLLDTLPFLHSAIHLYKRYGFYEVESYNDSPMSASIYMKLDL